MGAGGGSSRLRQTTRTASPGGKKGIFQYTARGTCSATNLAARRDVHFERRRRRQLHRDASRMCSAASRALGESGCGFKHQFAAILRALGADGHPAPAENQGFLRPEAALAIVMLTNEDDCSASPGVPLFDTGSNLNMASQLGPPTHFRCNEFGHLCPRAAAPITLNRNAPNNDVTATVSYDTACPTTAKGYLLSATDTANRIKALQGRSVQDHRRLDPGRSDAVCRALEQPADAGHVLRLGFLSLARGHACVHRLGRSLRRSGRPHRTVRAGIRDQRPRAVRLRRQLRSRPRSRRRMMINRVRRTAVHPGAGRVEFRGDSPTAR